MGTPYRYLIFDLDDTLYPRASGLQQEVRRRIIRYMVEQLGMPAEEAVALRQRYVAQYGTTWAGLLRHQRIDLDSYMVYVHDIPLPRYLHVNRTLDAVLEAISLQKIVWTNAPVAYAERVLHALGIRRHFARIVDVQAMNNLNKPMPEVYPRVLGLLGTEGAACILVEDSVNNLRAARSVGMVTVLVDGPEDANADFVIKGVEEIGEVLRRLQGGKWGVKPFIAKGKTSFKSTR